MKQTLIVLAVILAIGLADNISDNPDTKLPAEKCHFEKGECCNENCPDGNGRQIEIDTTFLTPIKY